MGFLSRWFGKLTGRPALVDVNAVAMAEHLRTPRSLRVATVIDGEIRVEMVEGLELRKVVYWFDFAGGLSRPVEGER